MGATKAGASVDYCVWYISCRIIVQVSRSKVQKIKASFQCLVFSVLSLSSGWVPKMPVSLIFHMSASRFTCALPILITTPCVQNVYLLVECYSYLLD
jgi:hypothetical protein